MSTSREVVKYCMIPISRIKSSLAILLRQLPSAVSMPNAQLIFWTPQPFNAIEGIYITCH